jgi:hypothetical protein
MPPEMTDSSEPSVELGFRFWGRDLVAMGTCLAAYVFYKPGRFLVWTVKGGNRTRRTKMGKVDHFLSFVSRIWLGLDNSAYVVYKRWYSCPIYARIAKTTQVFDVRSSN